MLCSGATAPSGSPPPTRPAGAGWAWAWTWRGPGPGSTATPRCRPRAEDLLSVNRGKKKKLVTELIVRLATPGVDTVMFSSLLRFLYTGEYPSQVWCAGAALSLSKLT